MDNTAAGAPSAAPAVAPGESARLVREIAVALLAALCGAVVGYLVKPVPPDETRFISFDAESSPPSVLAAGWSSFEQLQPSGDTFAWCSAKACSLRVQSHAEGDRLLRVRVSPFLFPGSTQQTITAHVNQGELGTKPLVEGMTVVTFRAARGVWTKGPNEIRFDFAFAEDPKSKIPGAEDPRKLAAAFDWVEIAPL